MFDDNSGFNRRNPQDDKSSSELDLFSAAADGLDRSHFGLTEDGTAYVVAGPFAHALGYRDAEKATRLLDRAEVGTQKVGTSQVGELEPVVRRMSVIYEDGIWELIFRSTLPGAKAIKARVKAILRELRETGLVDMRQQPMTELEMARRYVAALERNQVLEPKAQAYDEFLSAEGDYLIGVVGKMLGVGQNTLFARLRAERILISGGDRHNTPYQQYMRHFRVVSGTYTDTEGVSHARHTTYVKPSGVDFIRKVLKLQQSVPAA